MKVSKARLRKDVAELVRIPSIHDMDSIGKWVLKRLNAAGVKNAHRDKLGNVIGSVGKGDGLLLNAHMDTVGVVGFKGDPFRGTVYRGRLYGRGACDCKSGVAGMLEIARLITRVPLKRRVIFSFSVWEEQGANPDKPIGSLEIAKRQKATQGIVTEQTVKSRSVMKVQVGCQGVLRFDIRVKGKACHSSQPQRGDNALYRAAKFVRRFEKEFKPENMPVREFAVLGKRIPVRCVATLTEIEARAGRNIIPGECVLGLDCRLIPGQDADQVIRRVKALAREVAPGKMEIVDGSVHNIGGHVCEDVELIGACRAAARENGFRAPLGIMTGRADSTIFQNTGGIPCVTFGPGNCGEAHTNNESLWLELFYRGAQASLDAVLALVRA